MNEEGDESRVNSEFSAENNEEIKRKNNSSTSRSKNEAGNYFIAFVIKKYEKAPFVHCIAREKSTGNCFLMKILHLGNASNDKDSLEKRSMFHNEHSILSLLKNYSGVIQLHDFFKDEIPNEEGVQRVCMVLECLVTHGYHNLELMPLDHILEEGKLTEIEALHIIYNLFLVIEELHKRKIRHNDLKLSNVIINRKTLKVKLTDFYYSKFNVAEVIYSTAGGITPKICDIWSAGVILYEMLNGIHTFGRSGQRPWVLNQSVCNFYMEVMEKESILRVSDATKELLRSILCTEPPFRLSASEAVDTVSALLAVHSCGPNSGLLAESHFSDQIVPECPDFDSKGEIEELKSESKSSFVVPEATFQPEAKFQEKEKNSKTVNCPIFSEEKQADVNKKQLKVAMQRLGATSVNCINALSFSYSKKNSSPC